MSTPLSPRDFDDAIRGRVVLGAETRPATLDGTDVGSVVLLVEGGWRLQVTNGGGPLLLEIAPVTGARLEPFGARAARLLVGAKISQVEVVQPSDGAITVLALWLQDGRTFMLRPDASRGAHSLRLLATQPIA